MPEDVLPPETAATHAPEVAIADLGLPSEPPQPADDHPAAPEPAASNDESVAAHGAAPAEEAPAAKPNEPQAEEPPPPAEGPPDGEGEQPGDGEPPASKKRWYVVKVQSGREESIRDAIQRRVKKEGLEEYFGQIVIPVEKITEVRTDKTGKRVTRTKERKLYPGYLMAEVEYNDRILYLFRETSGVGDFVGGTVNRPPPPMSEREIARMIGQPQDKEQSVPTPPKGMSVGDKVRVIEGTFNTMEGEVKEILEAVGKLRVELTIFGRPVKVELEYYQVELA
jgi:transcriptional antiterminator NusG